jgi:hypothetical protein
VKVEVETYKEGLMSYNKGGAHACPWEVIENRSISIENSSRWDKATVLKAVAFCGVEAWNKSEDEMKESAKRKKSLKEF